MRRTIKVMAGLAGCGLAVTSVVATHAIAADSKKSALTNPQANGVLRLCEFSDNNDFAQVRIAAEGPQWVVTGALPRNGQTCVDTEVPAGQYWVHPEKYAAAPCDNGPVGKGPTQFPTVRWKSCEAKFHHVHVTHSLLPLGANFTVAPYGSPVDVAPADLIPSANVDNAGKNPALSAEPTIETNDGDEWTPAYVQANHLTRVSYHDTDKTRAECKPAAPDAGSSFGATGAPDNGHPLGTICGH